MSKRFAYQPSWYAFCIFWGSIITGISLAIIIQEEVLSFSWLALIVLIVTLVIAISQKWRYRLTFDANGLTLHKFLPSNTLTITYQSIENFSVQHHQITLETSPYGPVSFTAFWRYQAIVAELEQRVSLKKEEIKHV
ncbi:EbsA family protein [Lacticaseibacillus brantae]|uniref:Pore-forming protein n=1 Tax=Lacticaseibacillus brantae DSM 23927 TaxID=1423727 RepID=A0A0R2AZD5_9LACO|nr:EbsA family protein [Lacticaseibacillus brantae]KRM72654.1 hypothetical protein FC34_GL000364 [Lacticaseibacillus brantae DSM 23927]